MDTSGQARYQHLRELLNQPIRYASEEIIMTFSGVIQFFCNHLVCLGCYVTGPNVPANSFINATAFVVAINDSWFLVTAGHVIDGYESLMSQGYNLECWALDDTFGQDAKSHVAIPFDYDGAAKRVINDTVSGVDYAILHLRPYYRQLLEQNGTVPMTDQIWQSSALPECDYWLLGVPKEDTNVRATSGPHDLIDKGYHMLRLMPLADAEVPEELRKPTPRFFARLSSQNRPRSIEGMSGGPIFAVRVDETEGRYWLVGVQSGWLPNQGIIAACPIGIFAEFAGLHVTGNPDSPFSDAAGL
jgi:hypothetical protein